MGRLTTKGNIRGMDGYWVETQYIEDLDPFETDGDLYWLAISKLAHYEDMEEAGRLIVLKPRTDIAKDNFISALVNSDAVCPEDMGFEQEDSDCKHGCRKCWEKYLSGAKLKELEGVKE